MNDYHEVDSWSLIYPSELIKSAMVSVFFTQINFAITLKPIKSIQNNAMIIRHDYCKTVVECDYIV